jgi:hypothetical protein
MPFNVCIKFVILGIMQNVCFSELKNLNVFNVLIHSSQYCWCPLYNLTAPFRGLLLGHTLVCPFKLSKRASMNSKNSAVSAAFFSNPSSIPAKYIVFISSCNFLCILLTPLRNAQHQSTDLMAKNLCCIRHFHLVNFFLNDVSVGQLWT